MKRAMIIRSILLYCLVVRNFGNAWQIHLGQLLSSTGFDGVRPFKQHSRNVVFVSSMAVQQEQEEESMLDSAATMRSVTFCDIPRDREPDMLANFLIELGAYSTSVTDADAGTEREQPLFGEPGLTPWQDSLHLTAPIWNRCNVTAHFGASADLPWVVSMVHEAFPDQFPHLDDADVSAIPNRDWVVHVQSSWKPIVVGSKFVLRFPWHNPQDIARALARASVNTDNDDDSPVELFLQGGIAFGTGEHPTTQLCLQWLDRTIAGVGKIDNDLKGSTTATTLRVLDYGSGSGVLGMAACKLSEKWTNCKIVATGVDLDVDACQIANQNARLNRVEMNNYLPPLWLETADEASKALWLQAHAQVQAAQKKHIESRDSSVLEEKPCSILWPEDESSDAVFDVCVANILAGPLVTLAPTLHSMMRAGAPIGMSGILAAMAEEVIEAYTEAGFVDMKNEDELNGWVLVTGRKA